MGGKYFPTTIYIVEGYVKTRPKSIKITKFIPHGQGIIFDKLDTEYVSSLHIIKIKKFGCFIDGVFEGKNYSNAPIIMGKNIN